MVDGSEMYSKAIFVTAVVLLGGFVCYSESLESILARCCNLGVRWAWDNKTCTEYPGPVSNVAAEHQGPCLSTIDACCNRNYRERHCLKGHETAKQGKECLTEPGQNGHYHKDCCEGCKLGLIAGAMGLHCEFQSLKLALGPPWDASLTKCCLQAGGQSLQVTRPSTLSPTPFTTRGQSTGHGQNTITYAPPPRPKPTHQMPQDFCAMFPGQLCSQNCVTEGGSYRCTCEPGFVLLNDLKSCVPDTKEEKYTRSPPPTSSTKAMETTTPRLTNHLIRERGQCPPGFEFNSYTQVCDDIDECATGSGAAACFPYKTCRNTIGSFICEQTLRENERNLQCPPGYRYDTVADLCVDLDECAEGVDICIREIQYCINTPGGFDCQGKNEFNRYNCPAGYKFNNATLNCDDVNECAEKLDSCDPGTEVCRNTAGAYECDVQCSDGFRHDVRSRSCHDVDECVEGTHDCIIDKESCVNVPGSYQCHQLQNSDNNCPPGYEPNRNFTFLCQDTNECMNGLHTCAESEACVNEIGGYRCERNSGNEIEDNMASTESDEGGNTDNQIPDSTYRSRTNTDQLERNPDGRENANLERKALSNSRADPRTNTVDSKKPIVTPCAAGFKPIRPTRPGEQPVCEDIDECVDNNPCDSSQLCQNTPGSYYCHCRSGYYRDPITRACQDINECLTSQHNCAPSQRCDNSPGSYTCIRITGCGTGYTLNSQTGQCEDDDECIFGSHNCDRLGPEWQCKNTLGSFRCERRTRTCGAGLSLAPNGECRTTCPAGYQFNARGECVDIDECITVPGARGVCNSNQQCVNSQGSYQCMSRIICPGGFEPDANSQKCMDINECERGLHTCRGNQQCVNRGGGYLCQCPLGYSVTPGGDCEDINECVRYSGQVCSSNSECHNTQGSYRCICNEGFEQGHDNRTCADMDECTSIPGLCEQNCINTWGSYKCSCGNGWNLGDDGRSCRDIDECATQGKETGYLCIGNCVNTHGSYRCDCPDGYRLGNDGRTCQDIDECIRPGSCRSDETCLNTRGGFRCNRIHCPHGYQKEGDQNDRCKKTTQCTEGDTECMKQPLTISRNYISFTSNVRIPSLGYVDLFTMRGPSWAGAVMHFNMEVKSTRVPTGIVAAGRNHFLLRRPTPYQAVIALAKPIAGPQDVELELTMEVTHRGAYAGSALAQIVIVVTGYEY